MRVKDSLQATIYEKSRDNQIQELLAIIVLDHRDLRTSALTDEVRYSDPRGILTDNQAD